MGRRSSSKVRAERERAARPAAARPDDGDEPLRAGSAQEQTWRGRAYLVRPLTGQRAVKAYRCPGCDHEVAVGVPHQVVWPADGAGGPGDRRHWHSPCWTRRAAARARG